MSQPLWELLGSGFLCWPSSAPAPLLSHTLVSASTTGLFTRASPTSLGKPMRAGLLLPANTCFHLWCAAELFATSFLSASHVRSRYFRPLSLQLVWPVNKCPIIHVTDCLRLPFTARRIDVSRPAQSEVSRGLEGRGAGWGGCSPYPALSSSSSSSSSSAQPHFPIHEIRGGRKCASDGGLPHSLIIPHPSTHTHTH